MNLKNEKPPTPPRPIKDVYGDADEILEGLRCVAADLPVEDAYWLNEAIIHIESLTDTALELEEKLIDNGIYSEYDSQGELD